MTVKARDAILQAFQDLETSTRRAEFQLSEVVSTALRIAPQFEKATIMTYITSVMCTNAPIHHANHTDDLVRVGRGQYRRAVKGEAPDMRPATAGSRPTQEPTSTSEFPMHTEPQSEWFWEGNIQAAVVSHLASEHWSILAVADTESRESGADVRAKREGQTLWVEVKGYPSSFYARGPKRGQRKPTTPATQARTWFSNALLTGVLLRSEYPDDLVWLVFADFQTYASLARRINRLLNRNGIEVRLVDEQGSLRSVDS